MNDTMKHAIHHLTRSKNTRTTNTQVYGLGVLAYEMPMRPSVGWAAFLAARICSVGETTA